MQDKKPSMDSNTDNVPNVLPILPLFDATLFPKMVLPLVVLRGESVHLIDEAMANDRMIGLLVAKKQENVRPDPESGDLATVGTAAMILKMAKSEDNHIQLLVQGLSRFRVKSFQKDKPYLVAEVEHFSDINHKDNETEALMANAIKQFSRIVQLSPGLPQEMGSMAASIKEPGTLADMMASTINSSAEEKQQILEMQDSTKRLKAVTKLLHHQLEILELGNKIQSQVKGDMDKRQREYYLRQQLKAIKEELGETDEATVELDEYRAKIIEKKLPEEAVKEAERELDRLARMHSSSAEYTVAMTYLDWLTSLPWSELDSEEIDIARARAILDDDHYGLEKIKRRILEYLAVRKLNPDGRSPILCFVGPPGVGKTSLGQSIARALGLQFVRASLGGVHDEAEIRGHRRTYIGALPGSIVQSMRKAGTRNPVFMLDEMDKLGAGFHGDPSSALLEVLDPEQNGTFGDNYLGVPFDLSKVLFIGTANVLENIPGPLRDRMEVIELPGYTQEEKLEIAERYLIDRQLEATGLTSEQVSVDRAALVEVIDGYTREAGVRNLEREIGGLFRHAAMRITEDAQAHVQIGAEDVAAILGPRKFEQEVQMRTSVTGVATGLAWTPVGGDILFIEATAVPGQGKLILTGQLGDVMKESAQAALSLAKGRLASLPMEREWLDQNDLHVHVPAGAIPKDGPSAGVAMFVAIMSLLSGRKVRSDIAMTGEVSLRGLVMPVGGVKEKTLAALRAGITTVALPARNRKDLEDIPASARKQLEFIWLETVEDAMTAAFELEPDDTAKAA